MIRSLYLPRHGASAASRASRLVSVLAGHDVRRFTSQTKVKSSEKEEKPADDAVLAAKKKMRKEVEDLPVDYSDISRAKVAIRGGIRRTECTKSYFLSELIGANVYLKPEYQQFTGSFKERGARNAILQLMREKGSSLKGVIAASAGNHALALAYHGKLLGVPVTVVMPRVAPLAKVDKCRVRTSMKYAGVLSYRCDNSGILTYELLEI
jgi:predicted alternative tryptophan synthase beta-subunit